MEKLSGKNFISIHNLSASKIGAIFDLSAELKAKQKKGEAHHLLSGKTLALIFEKPSTRTRVSFEVGMYQLGGKTVHLSPRAVQLGVREAISDVARTLSRYVDGVMLRTFHHKDILEFERFSDVPVINGLSDLLHPCQALADVFTVREKKGDPKGLKFAYIGDGNNVCHSLMFCAAKVGMNMTIAVPRGYEPKEKIVKLAFEDGKNAGIEIDILNDPVVAVRDADVIYTDVWASMGQEKESKKRKKAFKKFQVNQELVKLAKKDAIIMHCLPAHRGDEITDEVLDGPNSVVFDQAENRLHVQKAILALLLR
jgi:ornithine carbamoyltransferase